MPTLAPIAAYDILPDGKARALDQDWPTPGPGSDVAWRWIHCDRTAPGFIAWSAAHLPHPVRAGLMQAETRPHFESIGDGFLVTLRGINLNPGEESEDMVALRLWIGPGLVVSTRMRRIFAFEDLLRAMAEGQAPATPASFVARLIDALTLRIEATTAEREDRTDEIEEILLDDQPDTVGKGEMEIARLARSVIKLRRHIAPQREALSRLAAAEGELFGSVEGYDIRNAANRTVRAVEELDTVRDRLASLRAHTDSLQAARLGRNSFILSVVAAVFLPLGFLTGLFGVNVAGMPGTDWPWAFAALSGATAVMGLGLWLVFRWMKWF
ncbi:zinc transporter ZntB [Defluviimonas aestuarii]|uniref:zinc transporter ZntB n=1 Tax=Albidovulum aestuarii TaxID=1130726 RepID=UPI00249B60AF|nr:zinc transporter ZntB [Defluviimonas aestuarii]MDI3334862.1 zinc transporter ZntB [Defluviimonas aestuarii]